MGTIRQEQVGRMLQRVISDVLQKEGPNIYGRAFVTVAGVNVTPDLGIARIYVSVYNVEDKEAIVNQINEGIYVIKKRVYAIIRSQLRRMPILEFYLDESLDEVFKIESLLEKLKEEEGTKTAEESPKIEEEKGTKTTAEEGSKTEDENPKNDS